MDFESVSLGVAVGAAVTSAVSALVAWTQSRRAKRDVVERTFAVELPGGVVQKVSLQGLKDLDQNALHAFAQEASALAKALEEREVEERP